ncbi:MAG: SDR family oxidoreductase [Pseudomonadota bacterium]|nr:SDR family oxidoreductase [Pseudomonadota bacterium]
MASIFNLNGKTAIVTGSSRGIGKEIARHLVFYGANVVISSRDLVACENTASEINFEKKQENGLAFPIAAHIGKHEDLKKLVRLTTERFGPPDILVTNAAINPVYGPMLSMKDEEFSKILNTNVVANFHLIKLVAAGMKKKKSGSIIVVSSIGGIRADDNIGGYCVSKAADLQMVRNLASEFGKFGIRVNAISPGLVKTEFARKLWEDKEVTSVIEKKTPLGRLGRPEEFGGIAVFLASEASSFATGQNFIIDGGASII